MALDRRQFLVGSLGVAGAAALAACSNSNGKRAGTPTTTSGRATPSPTAANALAAPGSAGLIDEAVYQARVSEYLKVATAKFDPSDATSIGAHLVAAHRDPEFVWTPSAVTVESLQPVWQRIDEWQDTRDFRLMYLLWVLHLADRSSPMTTIDTRVIDAIEQRMVENRYRYDDPLPAGRVDNLWFWSENHIAIGLVSEYLAGMRYPDRTFTVTGLTGAEHARRSKQPILDWVHERARFGFFEWHSNVYMLKSMAPLLTLADLATDPELVVAAGMALDLCVLDMAGHCHAGTYTAPRGRTYAKDKLILREPTFNTFKLFFDDTDVEYGDGPDTGATYVAASKRYRPPQVLVEMAGDANPGVVRERHGIFVDGTAPITANPKAPFGYSFDDQQDLAFWWSQGMLGTWQITEAGLKAAKQFRIFESTLMAPVAQLVALNGGDPERIRKWELANHAIVNYGHLREANTYGWRSDAVSLATVVDHRFGQMRDQIHTWQAAVDPGAVVFTNHPRSDLPERPTWEADGRPGYFTGEASIPRSAQHERTGIHIYQPAWDASTDSLLWSVFGYQDYTHAYVPQDRFDDVVRDGHWTFARKGDGYIALWSWREPTWRQYDPAKNPTDGQTLPFDLVARGGADNVWIVEVGDPGVAKSFAAFMRGITKATPSVVRDDAGFTIAWKSPTAGKVTFGSTAPFTVGGRARSLDEFPRHESRWGTVERLSTKYALRGDRATLALDFDKGARSVGKQ